MATTSAVYEEQLVQEIRSVPQEYWADLLQIVRLFRESVELRPAEESFRRGWKEVMEGDVRPVSELWEGIDGESEGGGREVGPASAH